MEKERTDAGAAGKANALMRNLYDSRCKQTAFGFPVVVHLDDLSLVLRFAKRREAVENTHADNYRLLKDVVHIPLSLFLCFEQSLGPSALETAEAIRNLLPEVKEQVAASTLSEAAKKNQFFLLAESQKFLESQREIPAFMANLQHALHFNISLAVDLRINGMHLQMRRWAAELGADWSELRVVIATSHMARRDNLPEEYFSWLLRDEARTRENKRVIKVEGLGEEEDALKIFGTHKIDTKAGEAFFQNAAYLHHDVLGPKVPAILERLERFA